jgi:hypothetical protein
MYKQLRRDLQHLLFLALVLAAPAASVFASTKPILRAGERVKGEYLVRLNRSAGNLEAAGARVAKAHGATAVQFFADIRTMLVRMNERQAAALNRDARVDAVEENAIGHLATMTSPQTGLDTPRVAGSPASTWGLDRTDQSPGAPRLDDTYRWVNDGVWAYNGVTPAQIYVVDTGVLPYHPEFGWPNTRVEFRQGLADTLNGLSGADRLPPGQCWQNQGGFSAVAAHGTAVASIAAGETLGIAKRATIVDARTVDCNGAWTSARLIATLDWIKHDPQRRAGLAVINLSLGVRTGFSAPPDSALQAKIQALQNDPYDAIPIVIAAGNNGGSASNYNPNTPGAIVVGGMSQNADTLWFLSNYGSPVSVYAPAEHIESASTCMQNVYDGQGNLIYFCALQGGLTQPLYRSQLSDCGHADGNSDPYGCTSGTSFSAAIVSGVVARELAQLYRTDRPPLGAADINYDFFARVLSYVYEPATGRYVPILNYRDGRF